jgi:GSH-dependent disulfide-bond oxidoreductase
MSTNEYVPPTVWVNETNEDDNKFGSMNKPTAGARFEKELPVGKHPIQLYSLGTPNGVKVTIFLEEMLQVGISEVEYDAWPVNIMKLDQFGSDFVSINPNSKIPAMRIPGNAGPSINLFESGSIMFQLAEKYDVDGIFLPRIDQPIERSATINWLFWQMGSAPYLGGGFGHFYAFAKDKLKYPIDRFTMETKRQLDVLNKQLESNQFIVGDKYTIADMAIYPWYGSLVLGSLFNDSSIFLNVKEEYPHLIRWANEIKDRPAVKRGSIVSKMWGEEYLPERHDATDFDTKVITGPAIK